MSGWGTQRVLIVGMGGLGCPAAMSLARAGVGALTLADADRVDLSNLPRQPLYADADVGAPKVEAAARRLSREFPNLGVRTLAAAVSAQNVEELFASHDAVIDGTDQISAKLLLSDAAVASGKWLVHGGALRLEGQAMLIGPGGPCLRCLFEETPAAAPSCAQAGILGTVAGVVGAMQALLALGALAGRPLLGTMLRFDAASLRQRPVHVPRAPDCPACGPVRPLPTRSDVSARLQA